MNIQITYEKNTDVDAPCWAKTEVKGQTLHALGKTWEEAKARLIAKVESWLGTSTPPSETVEIKSADEEMQTEFIPWKEPALGRSKLWFEGGQVVREERL